MRTYSNQDVRTSIYAAVDRGEQVPGIFARRSDETEASWRTRLAEEMANRGMSPGADPFAYPGDYHRRTA